MLKPEAISGAKIKFSPPTPQVFAIDLSVISETIKQELEDRVQFLTATPKQLLNAGWDLGNLPEQEVMSEILQIFKFVQETEGYVTKEKELYTKTMAEAEALREEAARELRERHGLGFEESFGLSSPTDTVDEESKNALQRLRFKRGNNNRGE